MNVKSRLWSRGFTLSTFVAIMLACGVRQDEFECENAYAHLQQCCGSEFVLKPVNCRYIDGSCDEGPTYPDIDIEESGCIRAESCDALVGSGVCTRASQMTPVVSAAGSLYLCPGERTPAQNVEPEASAADDAASDDGASTALDAANDALTETTSDSTADASSVDGAEDATADATGPADGEVADGPNDAAPADAAHDASGP